VIIFNKLNKIEEMRLACPVELNFDIAIEKGKDSLRKASQRHNERLAAKRAAEARAATNQNNHNGNRR